MQLFFPHNVIVCAVSGEYICIGETVLVCAY